MSCCSFKTFVGSNSQYQRRTASSYPGRFVFGIRSAHKRFGFRVAFLPGDREMRSRTRGAYPRMSTRLRWRKIREHRSATFLEASSVHDGHGSWPFHLHSRSPCRSRRRTFLRRIEASMPSAAQREAAHDSQNAVAPLPCCHHGPQVFTGIPIVQIAITSLHIRCYASLPPGKRPAMLFLQPDQNPVQLGRL